MVNQDDFKFVKYLIKLNFSKFKQIITLFYKLLKLLQHAIIIKLLVMNFINDSH